MRNRLTLIVATLLVIAMPASAAVADEHHSVGRGIQGTWLSIVYFSDGSPLIQMLQTFTTDGRTTLLLPLGPDALLPAPVDPPTANSGDPRIGCTGEWRYAGARTFDVTMYCLWRQNPGVTPDRIRFRLKLDKGGARLSGPFKYLYSDPVYPPGFAGMEFDFTLESTRLGLVPLE